MNAIFGVIADLRVQVAMQRQRGQASGRE